MIADTLRKASAGQKLQSSGVPKILGRSQVADVLALKASKGFCEEMLLIDETGVTRANDLQEKLLASALLKS